MHRTLFTPAMLETFRSCPRAYALAFLKYSNGGGTVRISVLLKKFLLRALAEINRRRITSVNHVQKHIGQNWPVAKMEEQVGDREVGTRAFLFAYKCLTRYVAGPYLPKGAEVVAVALRVRARIAHVRVYVEDTLDLVLWYPQEKKLELVDFQFKPQKPFDPAWPSPSLLVRHYLGERLKTRWPFEKLAMTKVKIGVSDFQATSVTLEESIFRLHWPELVGTLEEMKKIESQDSLICTAQAEEICPHCRALADAGNGGGFIIRLTA